MGIQNEDFSLVYKKDMELIQDFFEGKTKGVEQALLKEINICIDNQNFEWAAKLRDMYQNIDQFTQKQTVIVDTFINGIVAKIVQIESQWIIIVLIFQQGKLIDIIRSKESIDEIDYDQLKLSIELEFGDVKEKDNLIISSGIKINKELKTELEMHFEQYISSFIASGAWQKDSIVNDILKGLQERYNLNFYPYRLECLDISHFSGGRASGGLSCLVGGITEKRGYRRYKIKQAKGGDDYDSLREVIMRRFGKTKGLKGEEIKMDNNGELIIPNLELLLPDLFILDGAEKQLEVVKKLFETGKLNASLLEHIQFVSLGKGSARKSGQKIKGEKEKLYVLKAKTLKGEGAKMASSFEFRIESFELFYDEVDKMLVRIRDEAHRFANSYRKKQMSMEIAAKAKS